MRTRHGRTRDDAGFTLIEVGMVMVIFGVLSAIAIGGIYSLRDATAEQGAQREIVSGLREWQTRAVARATTYCVDFGATTSDRYNVYLVPGADSGVLPAGFACATGTKVSGPVIAPSRSSYSAVAFSQRNGADTAYVLFYPRGAASPGSLRVIRDKSTKSYTVSVEGLTARVSSTGN